MLGAGARFNLLAAAEAAANNEQHGLGTHAPQRNQKVENLPRSGVHLHGAVCSRSVRAWSLDFCFSNGHSWRSKVQHCIPNANP